MSLESLRANRITEVERRECCKPSKLIVIDTYVFNEMHSADGLRMVMDVVKSIAIYIF